MAKLTLDDIRKNPPKLSAEQKARLDAMSEAEIERNALSDPDNPPLTDDELDRGVFGRLVRQTREKLGLSQAQFAERFDINLGRLRDWEQGRYQPDSVAWAYVKVIASAPATVERALGQANRNKDRSHAHEY